MEMGFSVVTVYKNQRAEMTYDVAVIGGGLAGLATAIQMTDFGKKVILFEKKQYPFHRVCGEYISMESWGFLNRLGLDLENENLPVISKLSISSPSGRTLSHQLDSGGFGISRFKLDNLLADQARLKGVQMQTSTTVSSIIYQNSLWKISTSNETYYSRAAVGAFGKRSNLDIQQKRKHAYLRKQGSNLTNYVAVKYHVKADLPADVIELHNFDQGYCGISKIEDDRYCMCYLTTAKNLEKSGNDLKRLESEILAKNPYLKAYFMDFERIYDKPLSIAQIDFSNKLVVENKLMMIGDASGLIAPLCGNGMSMALRGSSLGAPLLDKYLNDKINLSDMQNEYRKQWKDEFSNRLTIGRIFQVLFGNTIITEGVIAFLKQSPRIMNKLVHLTHGKPF